MDAHAPDTTPAALSDLITAGLVSHEVIGDPERLGAEAETLRVLCGLIAGPVWRIDSFHYAFRAQPTDLGGRLADAAPTDWTVALEAALQAELGPEAIWVSAADLFSAAAADLDQPLLLLRAQAGAVAGALEAAPPGMQAVVQARYATEVARLTAGAEAGSALDRRLAAIEVLQERMLDLLASRQDDTMLAALDGVLHRLEAQDHLLRSLTARVEGLAAQPAPAAAPDDFRETLGLTLAEFLARLETQPARGEPARALFS